MDWAGGSGVFQRGHPLRGDWESHQKTYGEGLSYDAFLKSPLACPSIIRPELSRIHEGIALRDEAWERAHHLTPHVVYLSQTSHVKVGVTRKANVPSRWVTKALWRLWWWLKRLTASLPGKWKWR